MVLVKDGDRWAAADPRSWGSEADLEQVLADHPYLIPGCDSAAVARQFAIAGVGVVDLVCTDEFGTITLIECKLARNAEIRRAVIGQIFAYASGLTGTSEPDFSTEFARRSGSSLLSALPEADVDADELSHRIGANLAAGRLRLVVAVDAITSELRAIIEYLNVHLGDSVSIMALELGRVLVGGAEVLVPATYGAEVADRKAATSGVRRRWSAEDLEGAAENVVDAPARDFVQELLSYAQTSGAVVQGGGGRAPSAGFYYVIDGTRVSVWSLYVKEDDPILAFNLGSIARASRDLALTCLAALRQSRVLAGKLPEDENLALGRYTEFPAVGIANDPVALQSVWSAIECATRRPRDVCDSTFPSGRLTE
ncbi:hypothetical protein ACFV9C_40605 [Kribbella sp. NPDC059898]|uniref:hypothetical protein n=1 Tax=Kribbella sp. NPDC059898 TaxID=3346995 RepID=UPI0036487229